MLLVAAYLRTTRGLPRGSPGEPLPLVAPGLAAFRGQPADADGEPFGPPVGETRPPTPTARPPRAPADPAPPRDSGPPG